MQRGQIADAGGHADRVGDGLRIDVGVARVRRIDDRRPPRLPSQVSGSERQRARQPGLNRTGRRRPGQRRHPEPGDDDRRGPEGEQVPGRLVGDGGEDRQREAGVDHEKPAPERRLGPRRMGRRPRRRRAGGGQDEHQRLGPPEAAGRGPGQQAEVEVPRVHVVGRVYAALQVGGGGPKRLQDAVRMGQERRIEEGRDRHARTDGDQRGLPPFDVRGHDGPPRRPERPPGQRARGQRGGKHDDRRFLGRGGEARRHASQRRPPQAALRQRASDRDRERQGETGEHRLLDVHPRVEDHRGRRRHQHGGRRDRHAADRGGEERQQQEGGGAERRRQAAQRPFVGGSQRRLAAKPGDRQRQVVERRAVVIEGVVDVAAGLEQCAELDRLVGLVVVHRPDVEARQPQREPRHQRDGDDDRRACRARARQRRGGRPAAPQPRCSVAGRRRVISPSRRPRLRRSGSDRWWCCRWSRGGRSAPSRPSDR